MGMKIGYLVATIVISILLLMPTMANHTNPTSRVGRGFSLPILHEEHPTIQRYISRVLKPQLVSNITNPSLKGVYYAKFLVCNPQKLAYAVLDTGSYFTWLVGNQYGNESSSYIEVGCEESICWHVPNNGCTNSMQCLYQFGYPDGTSAVGKVGIDWFHLYKSLYDANSTDSFPLAYGIATMAETSYTHPGVMGVSDHRVGILTSLKVDRYSACFPSSYKRISHIAFGDDADLRGETTPIFKKVGSSFTLFKVNSITVGGTKFNLTDENDANSFAFDTGAGSSYLRPSIMDLIANRVTEMVQVKHDDIKIYEICYATELKFDLAEISLSFELDGGTILYFDFHNIWLHHRNNYCLAFSRAKTVNNIFGMRQMLGRNFGIDLHDNLLYHDYC